MLSSPPTFTSSDSSATAKPHWIRGIFVALFLSNVGTSLQITAQAWLVWTLTHSPAALGLLGLVQATPLLGVSLLGGTLADHFPRRNVLLCTQSIMTLLALLTGILALEQWLALPVLLLLAGLLATISVVDNPIRQVYVSGVATTEQRGRIVGLSALTYNAGMVVGPALAGIVLPFANVSWCFLLNALSYVFVIGWLLVGPSGRPTPVQATKKRQSGVQYIRQHPPIQHMYLLIAIISLLGRSYPTILPALVNGAWKSGAQTYGVLAALPGVGAFVAAAFALWQLGQKNSLQRWWFLSILLGCAIVGMGIAPNLFFLGSTLLVLGFLATGMMTFLNASLQLAAPDDVRGRIVSFYTWLAAGMPALGGWLFGTLMSMLAPRLVFVVAGVLLVVVVLLNGKPESQILH